MNFGDTVTLGDLLMAGSILIGGIGAAYSIYFRLVAVVSALNKIEKRIDHVDAEMEKQTSILVELAQTRERMNAIDARVSTQDRRIEEIWHRFMK